MFCKEINEKELFDKSDIAGFKDNFDLDMKIAAVAWEAVLKAVQDKIVIVALFIR